MARIMCTGRLWQRLRQLRRPPSRVAEQPMPGISLGPWAAKVFKDSGRDFVLVLEQRTYLTLLFLLPPIAQFRPQLSGALANALIDVGVPPAIACTECAAIEFEPLARLEDSLLRERLDDVEFTCGIEFSYHTDLRIIQRNLNDFPHPDRDPCTPVEGVRRLFDCRRSGPVFVTQ
jgi:hypothetical protein